MTEVYGSYTKQPHHPPEYEVEWENRFQFTPQGKYWADVGGLVELERGSPTEGGQPFEIRYGLLLEKQVYRWVGTVNLFLENHFGPYARGQTDFQSVGRLRYLLNPRFQPDVEYYGAPGGIGRFETLSRQQHDLGPGFAGVASLAGATSLRYSATLLFGLTPDSPNVTPVARLEYEFY